MHENGVLRRTVVFLLPDTSGRFGGGNALDKIFGVDWSALLALDTPILEIFLRGTLTYISLFVLLRLVLKRQAGAVGITDLLVVVLLADAAQNAMAGNYQSITSGIILVATIIFWSFAFDWLGFRFPAFQRFLRPHALMMVQDGKLLKRNMRHEFISEDELMSLLREQGVEDLSQVRHAYMEGDGQLSVIMVNGGSHNHRKKRA
jgi:uncharacterized membrane protein YcaP (DUF421 family)